MSRVAIASLALARDAFGVAITAKVASPTTPRIARAISPRLDSFRSDTGRLVTRNADPEHRLGRGRRGFAVVVVFDFLLRRSTAFRKVFYTGSNEKAAAYSGIRTKRVIFATTVLCSTLSGLAGII